MADVENLRCKSALKAKIDRAKEHILELEELIARVTDSKDAKELRREYNPETRELSFVLKERNYVTLKICVLAAEIIHQLRTSLDHLIWRRVEFCGKTPPERLAFPICDTLQAFSTWRGTVKYLPAEYVAILEGMQPYTSGALKDNPLWRLKKLNDADKHRTIYFLSVLVCPKNIAARDGRNIKITRLFGVNAKSNTEVFACITDDPEMEMDIELAREVVINEACLAGPTNVVPLIHDLYEATTYVLVKAGQFLKE